MILLIYALSHRDSTETMAPVTTVNPGTYTSVLTLGDQKIDVIVQVDENGAGHASLKSTDENIALMYPLLETCIENISSQLASGPPLNQIEYSASSRYTTAVLVEAINAALQKAAP